MTKTTCNINRIQTTQNTTVKGGCCGFLPNVIVYHFSHLNSNLDHILSFQLDNKLPPSDKLKELVHLGIPHNMRPKLWMRLSGGQQKKETSQSSYKVKRTIFFSLAEKMSHLHIQSVCGNSYYSGNYQRLMDSVKINIYPVVVNAIFHPCLEGYK